MAKYFFFSLFFILLGSFFIWPSFCVQAFGVSPATFDLQVYRGDKLDQSFKTINPLSSNQTYYLKTMAFEPNAQEGTPIFDAQKKDLLSSWIIFPENPITIEANSWKEIPFSLMIPLDISSGTYHTSITISPAPSEIISSSGASVEGKTAILLFVTILGETKEEADIIEFKPTESKSFFSTPPQEFSLMIQNKGNVLLVPTGIMQIKNSFGQIVASFQVNEQEGRLLPQQTRTYPISWGPKESSSLKEQWLNEWNYLHFGRYTAHLDLFYGSLDGSKKMPLQATTTFWIIPWHIAISFIVILFFLLDLFIFFPRLFKKRNKKFIS